MEAKHSIPKVRVMIIHPPSRWTPNLPLQDTHLTLCGTVIIAISILPHYKQLHGCGCRHTLRWNIFRWSIHLATRHRANGEMERLLDECREVKEHERRGIKCFAWTKMVESDGGQMFKVVEGDWKAEQLTMPIRSWERSHKCELRYAFFALSRHPLLRIGLFF